VCCIFGCLYVGEARSTPPRPKFTPLNGSDDQANDSQQSNIAPTSNTAVQSGVSKVRMCVATLFAIHAV